MKKLKALSQILTLVHCAKYPLVFHEILESYTNLSKFQRPQMWSKWVAGAYYKLNIDVLYNICQNQLLVSYKLL